MCTHVSCPSVACGRPLTPPGECCPVCTGICLHQGEEYQSGSTFTSPSDPCSSCSCLVSLTALNKWSKSELYDSTLSLASRPLIRMRWWTVRRDLVRSSAPIRSLQTPAAPSVTPVSMRVSSTLTVTPSRPPPTPVNAVLVSEAPLPVCPWSARQHPAYELLPSQDNAVLSAQVRDMQRIRCFYWLLKKHACTNFCMHKNLLLPCHQCVRSMDRSSATGRHGAWVQTPAPPALARSESTICLFPPYELFSLCASANLSKSHR